jgi:hypothetical protein
MPTDAISQTDDLSGGQTETEVPDIENTSPMEGETMYGRFTALAESGLSAPGNTTFPTDLSTQIALRIVTANSQRRVFSARNVDTAGGVAVPALKPASYLAIWTLVNSNGDERLMATRFVEQLGRAGPAPRAKVLCAYTSSLHNRIGCRVSFAKRARVKGKVRVRLSRGGVIVGLGHARLHHGRAGVTLHVLRRVRSGGWRATVVLARTHLAAVTQTVRLAGVS